MAYFHTTVLDNQIKALPTTDTASGSIATFDTDLTENLVEVKCQIVATQSGSGTPSPSNPRPITTYTEMNVFQNQKNYLNPQWVINGKYVSGTDGSINNSSASNVVGLFYAFSRTIRFSWDYETLKDSQARAICYYDSKKAFVSSTTYNPTVKERTISVPDGCYYVAFTVDQNFTNMQLETGSSYTTYEQFNGSMINIPFGQTVANGVLDINSGKLRVTHGIITYNDGSVFSLHSSNRWYLNQIPTNLDTANKTQSISNVRTYNDRGNYYGAYFAFGGSGIYINKLVNSETQAEFETMLSTTPMVVVYPLATPIEIQLDSITLQALLNENNIWCDTGDTEVKFLLTVGKKIS